MKKSNIHFPEFNCIEYEKCRSKINSTKRLKRKYILLDNKNKMCLIKLVNLCII